MKIKDGFILKSVSNMNLIVPLAENSTKYSNVMVLNDTGAFIFQQLEKETDKETIINAMIDYYQIDEQTASDALEKFLLHLDSIEVLDK